MPRRGGSADLPLHGGRVPKWLGERMTRLGAVIAEAIVLEYGRDELLRRLAHPFWFQSFGAVMGMDWHSSGITTCVIGALKRGLTPLSGELGVHVCGGRGTHSRKTPHELVAIGDRVGFDGAALGTASRLVAKVDSAAVQDGFDLYLHGFIVTDDGTLGRRPAGHERRTPAGSALPLALRRPASFVEEPHAAIDGVDQGVIVNLTDRRAEASRRRQLDILGELGPDGIASELAKLEGGRIDSRDHLSSRSCRISSCPTITMCGPQDIVTRRLHANLAAAAECGPQDFSELLLVPGVGAADSARAGAGRRGRARRALSLQRPGAVLARPWRQGPASLSRAAQGLRPDHRRSEGRGQEGEARPVGRTRGDQAPRRSGAAARSAGAGPSAEALIAEERARSHDYGGMSVFGPEPPPRVDAPRPQERRR